MISRILALALVASACGGAQSTSPDPEPSATTTCDDLVVRYRTALATRTDACASDTDCAVYGGVDPDDICGGATDATTARQLTAISSELYAAGCPRPGYSCPSITLRCTSGSCR